MRRRGRPNAESSKEAVIDQPRGSNRSALASRPKNTKRANSDTTKGTTTKTTTTTRHAASAPPNHPPKMARNAEKSQSMLFRFREAQAADLGILDTTRTRRPKAISTQDHIPTCERWRGQVLKEI